MSSSKILSYMFFICWRFVHRTRAGFKLIAEVIQKIPVSSSGSAAVTERKYIAYLLLWSAFQRLAGARARLYHYRFLLPKQHVSSFFQVVPIMRSSSGCLVMFLACLSFCFLDLSACLSFLFCLLVFSASFILVPFLLLLFSVLLSWLFITFLGVYWRCVAFLARENVSVSLGGKRAVHKIVEGWYFHYFHSKQHCTRSFGEDP